MCHNFPRFILHIKGEVGGDGTSDVTGEDAACNETRHKAAAEMTFFPFEFYRFPPFRGGPFLPLNF